jgi:hypothetical protein
MTHMRWINKERIVCIAAMALLAITAHAITANALKQKPTTGPPTTADVALRGVREIETGPEAFSTFWNFGERNPFQPVIDRTEPEGHNTQHQQHNNANSGAPTIDPVVIDPNHEANHNHNIVNNNNNIQPPPPQQPGAGAEPEPEPDMPLTLNATIKVGSICALLEDEQTGLLTKCTVGDTIRGITVRGVFPTSVIVQDKTGKLHELKDALRRKYE